MHLEGYGCAGASATAYGLACMELEAGDSGVRSLVSVQGSLAMYAIWRWGSRGAEAAVAAADGRGRGDRLLRPDRARRRLGPRLDAHARAPRRQRLDPARAEDVDHQRLGRRRRGRVGARPTRACAASSCRRGRRASPPRTSTASCRCAHRSPPSCCSTTCACPADAMLPEATSLRGAAVLPERGPLRDRLGRGRRGARVPRGGAASTARSGSRSAGRSPPSRSSSRSSR